MNILIKNVFAGVILLALIGTAQAVPITYSYEVALSRITVTGNTSDLPDIEVGLVPNVSVVDGTFSYESSQAGITSGDFTLFRDGPNTINLNVSGFSFLYQSQPSTNNSRVLVADSTFGRDVFGVQGFHPDTIPGSFSQTDNISLGLVDSTDSVFSSQSSIPATLVLSDFDSTEFRFLIQRFLGNTTLIGRIVLEGSITNLELVSSVPLPAALPLYGTGLAIMGFIGWRRKQRKIKLH